MGTTSQQWLTQPRLEYIDIAKGIGIFLVVIGHCVKPSSILHSYIFSFHMPLFFFLSGLCFNDTKYSTFIPFLKRRVCTLLLPLLYFCIIMSILGMVEGSDFLLGKLRNGLFPSNPMWFLYVLFLCELLYWFINHIAHRTLYRVIILLVCLVIGVTLDHKGVQLPFSHCTIFAATFFYGIGHLCRGNIAIRITRLPAIIGGY